MLRRLNRMHGVSSGDKLTRVKNGIKLNRASRVSIIEFGLIKSAREERTSNKLLADRSYSPSDQTREKQCTRGKIALKISDDQTGKQSAIHESLSDSRKRRTWFIAYSRAFPSLIPSMKKTRSNNPFPLHYETSKDTNR